MLRWLALLTLAASAADHWTTYLCLRGPVQGWAVTEANPIASWLFENLGLVPGLLLDSGVTIAAVGFVVTTRHLTHWMKLGLLAVVSTATAGAVANNLGALDALGLPMLG